MMTMVVSPLVAVRKGPSHRSELVNQILFGEFIDIFENSGDWIYIKTTHDSYSGWVEVNSLSLEKIEVAINKKIISSFSAKLKIGNKEIRIPFGSFFYGDSSQILEGNFTEQHDLQTAISIIISQFNGAPYLWGGRTGFGIDCSGLTQLLYRLINFNLPRDAYLQAELGDDIFISQARAGDLLFYKNEDGKIVHVGIALDEKKLLHASGSTKIDYYDSQGILNTEQKQYTHEFALAKRIIKP